MAKLIEPEGTYLIWLDCRILGLPEEKVEHLIVHEAKLWLNSGAIFGTAGAGVERINIACLRAVLVIVSLLIMAVCVLLLSKYSQLEIPPKAKYSMLAWY